MEHKVVETDIKLSHLNSSFRGVLVPWNDEPPCDDHYILKPEKMEEWLMSGHHVNRYVKFVIDGRVVSATDANPNFKSFLSGVRMVHGKAMADRLAQAFGHMPDPNNYINQYYFNDRRSK